VPYSVNQSDLALDARHRVIGNPFDDCTVIARQIRRQRDIFGP